MDNGVTGQEMCEFIVKADILRFSGVPPTAEEIWNYSPSGELHQVFFWYELAQFVVKKRADNGVEA